MSEAAVHFPDIPAQKQGEMGVETGFHQKQALVFIQEKSCGWKEAGRLDVLLLRALCQLTLANQVQGILGFTSWELVETISQIRGRPWSDSTDKGRMSDDIRQYWNTLLKTWETKSEGIAQQFSDAQFTHIPLLQKTEGGGTGNPTLYRIGWMATTPASRSSKPDEPESLPDLNRKMVRYVCEDIEDANPFARIFTRGFQLKGWRRQLYIWGLGVPMLFLWLLLVQVVFGVAWSATVGVKNMVTSLLLLGMLYWVAMLTIGPFYRLGMERIVIAPWWMQSVDEDRLLERRAPPRYPDKSIKAVRYVTDCPLCGGKVSATKGRFEFFGRIVGRCEEAPVEHVYSFDHITRSGKLLR